MPSENLAKYSVNCTFSEQGLAQALTAVLAQKHMQKLKGARTDFRLFFFHYDIALIYAW